MYLRPYLKVTPDVKLCVYADLDPWFYCTPMVIFTYVNVYL